MRLAFLLILLLAGAFVGAPCSFAQETEKKSPVIEGSLGPGFLGTEQMSINKSFAGVTNNYLPLGRLRLRFDNGKFLRPEFIIEETGHFNFDRNGITSGKKPGAYGSYYLKLPLGIPVPFFSYKSSMALDAKYSTLRTGLRTKSEVVINNVLRGPGENFSAQTTEMTFRLYLNTPIVLEPDMFQYSYFGVYYSEATSPRSASPGTDAKDPRNLIVDTNARSGGIFYDMKKDTPLKGLGFEAAVYLGYADVEVRDSVSSVGATFGNTTALLAVRARGVLNYRYIFPNDLGLGIGAGVEYFSAVEFINAADKKKYGVNLGGDLKYFAYLSFLFAY